MKEQRFIELLNLYIDRQISTEETAELETEIQSSPKRQAVYRQYCQIHRATKMVYDGFRAHASSQTAPVLERPGVIELFETKRRHQRLVYSLGGLVAAACLTLVFVRQQSLPNATSLQPEPMLAASVPVEPVAEIIPVQFAEQPASLASLTSKLDIDSDYATILAAMREQDEERFFANRHLQVGLAQSLFDDGVFESQRIDRPKNPRVFRSQQTPAQQAEFTAFQFQR